MSSAKERIIEFSPEVGLILGSGLGAYGEKLENPIWIDYKDIPGFPVSKVEGHKNRFILGTLFGKRVIAMQGRFHYYEGIPQSKLALPIRLMKEAGVKTVILTNAAGGANKSFHPGDLMLITDHINYSGSNPLIGDNDDSIGVRFPDMSDVYTKALREKVLKVTEEEGISLRQGVYMMFSGPSFETPAEIRMAQLLGGDAAGMSTVPEAISAAHAGIQVIGISCITNMAAGILDQPLNHIEVLETAARVKDTFEKVVDLIIEKVV